MEWSEDNFIIRTTARDNVCVYFTFHRKLIKVFKAGTVKEKVTRAKRYVNFLIGYWNKEGIQPP